MEVFAKLADVFDTFVGQFAAFSQSEDFESRRALDQVLQSAITKVGTVGQVSHFEVVQSRFLGTQHP